MDTVEIPVPPALREAAAAADETPVEYIATAVGFRVASRNGDEWSDLLEAESVTEEGNV